ncbi:glycosyltransferase [Humitalea sp. 24SJ18S-53]|uniref:glycosyltransferase n=1 Tax=Humitalea sp. 24SJ18S-53 TaxID=3422307 RepID=UPI003D67112A
MTIPGGETAGAHRHSDADQQEWRRLRRASRRQAFAPIDSDDLAAAQALAEASETALAAAVAGHAAEAAALRERLALAEALATERAAALDALLGSTMWRATSPLRHAITLARRLRNPAAPPARPEPPPEPVPEAEDAGYTAWIADFDRLQPRDIAQIQAHIRGAAFPAWQIVVLLDEASTADEIAATLSSLGAQVVTDWRAEIVAPRPPALPHADTRISLAAPGLSTGEAPVLLLGPGAVLSPHALYMLAIAVAEAPEARLIYADEDQIAADGLRHAPWFKPDHSPELLRHRAFIGGCAVLRAGGVALAPLADPWALAAFAAGLPRATVRHVPALLSHALRPAPDARPAPPALLAEAALPRISIIIPTRNRRDLLEPCVESIHAITDWPGALLEVIVVDNASDDPDTIAWLETQAQAGRIRLIQDPSPFSYPRLNNGAARLAQGQLLVLLNNDTVVLRADWLRLLAGQAMQPDVAAVGAKLLYPDGTVQHGGVILGMRGLAMHAAHGLAADAPGYQDLAVLTHEVSAVTGACLAIRAEVFRQLGGLDEHLTVAFNDVLLCTAAIAAGYRNILVAEPLLTHFESQSRGPDDTWPKAIKFRNEGAYAWRHAKALFKNDPFYNPHFSIDAVHERACPPRAPRPWLAAGGDRRRVMLLGDPPGDGMGDILAQQVAHLAAEGFDICVAGPHIRDAAAIPGCRYVTLRTPMEAARLAFEQRIDCVVVQDPSFYATFRHLGEWPRSIAYIGSAPPPDLFPNAAERAAAQAERRLEFAVADRCFAVSAASAAETGIADMGVIPYGTSHLPIWTQAMAARRADIRARLGLGDRFVVLNLCRFGRDARHVNGLDAYLDASEVLASRRPDLAGRVAFLLAGRTPPADAEWLRAEGLLVAAPVSGEALLDLHIAADAYLNLALWDGEDFGIGQALAMGLPVLASGNPAHRGLGIAIADDPDAVADWIATQCEAKDHGGLPPRSGHVTSWAPSFHQMAEAIREVCAAPPRVSR